MRSRRYALWMLVFTLALATPGCGGDDVVGDATPPDAASDAALAVAPPDIGWLDRGSPVDLSACPAGWHAEARGELTVCEAFPAGTPEACAEGEAHFAGEAGCRPIGEPCPSGRFAASIVDDAGVVFVDVAAAPGGDGSRAMPLASLAEVPWPSLSSETTVALAAGSYEGTLPLRAGVRVVGACVASTILSGVDAPVPSLVSVASSGEPAVVANLTLRDAAQGGAWVSQGRALEMRGVLVERTEELGVVSADAGTRVVLDSVVIKDIQPRAIDGQAGAGIVVLDGGEVEATKVIVEQTREGAVLARAEGSRVALTDAVVRDTQARANGSAGRGINIQDGASLEAARVVVEDNREVGIFLAGAGPFRLEDVIVRRTLPAGDGSSGRGIDVQDGATIDAARLVLEDNHDIALLVTNAGTEATIADVFISGTLPRVRDSAAGKGIRVQRGARLVAQRIQIDSGSGAGLLAGADGTRVELRDALVRGPADDGGEGSGRGVEIGGGAHFAASRVAIVDAYELGLFGFDAGTELSLTDVVIRDTHPRILDDAAGRAIQLQDGAALEGERVLVDGALEVGVMVTAESTATMTDATVTRVTRAACAERCAERTFGYGVAAATGAVTLRGFEVRDAELCGVFVAFRPDVTGPSSLDLASGVVAGSQIGACVQIDGYDLDRLTRDVDYVDNGSNLDVTSLPVPSDFDVTER